MFRLILNPFTMLVSLFLLPIALFLFIFWLWMLIDCLKSDLKDSDKLIWILVIIFANFMGALIYLFFVKLNMTYLTSKKPQKGIKQLYRSKTNRVIAGVCGGIGEYLRVDPTLIRLIWILITFIGGSGIVAYIICWIVIPEES